MVTESGVAPTAESFPDFPVIRYDSGSSINTQLTDRWSPAPAARVINGGTLTLPPEMTESVTGGISEGFSDIDFLIRIMAAIASFATAHRIRRQRLFTSQSISRDLRVVLNRGVPFMKAMLYHGPRDIRLADVPRPVPTGRQVLVQVRACGICGSDLHTYRQGEFEDLGIRVEGHEGRVLGHEFAGVVAELGPDVTGVTLGERVAGIARGALSEYVLVETDGQTMYRLPQHVTYEEAATLEPLATSVHAAGLASPQPGETVVVLGAGLIGLGVLQTIRHSTADARVIVVDGSSARLDMALQLGAGAVVDFTRGDPVEQVLRLTGEYEIPDLGYRGGHVDAVIDCAGAAASPHQGLHMLKQKDGRLVLVALFEKTGGVDWNVAVRKHVRLLGSWAYTQEDFALGLELVATGAIDRQSVISHRIGLENAEQAFVLQESGQAIKVLVTP